VFAGQRAETFAIDLGAVFDTINLRVENATPVPGFRPPLPIQTAAEDANDFANPFGINAFSGFNVNTIAIEIPISRLTFDRQPANPANGVLGVYASTFRQRLTVRTGAPILSEKRPLLRGTKEYVQVSRMGNPLVNELIIPIGKKDFWNATDPEDEAQFVPFYQSLAVAQALQLVSTVARAEDAARRRRPRAAQVLGLRSELLGAAPPRHDRAADAGRVDQAPRPVRARRRRQPRRRTTPAGRTAAVRTTT
jgi:hypothetical protein